MTKQELINQLYTKFYKVPNIQFKSEQDGVREYYVYPLVKKGESVYAQYVSFYVEDEGEPTEAAYWGIQEPEKTQPVTFTSKVLDFIDAKIIAGTVKYAYIESINEDVDIAYVKAVTPANAVKQGLITESGGTLVLEII